MSESTENPAQDNPAQESFHLPEPNMLILAGMLMEQAMYAMGQMPGVPENEQKVDLNMAKFQIGLLEVLKEKTKGNLTEMEEKFLDEYLHQVRLVFLTVSKK